MWRERQRLWCGLPWTFTVYKFDETRLYIESGFLNKRFDEIRLYRVLDMTVTRSLIQRMFGLGTIHLKTFDKTLSTLKIKNIRNCLNVKEQLAQLVESERDEKRVTTREFVGDVEDGIEEM